MRVKRKPPYAGFSPGERVSIRGEVRGAVGSWLPPGGVVPVDTDQGEYRMTLPTSLRRVK